jgi:hypothetical protein
VGGKLIVDIIKGSGMGEHSLGVKVRWGGLVPGKKGTPEAFRGEAKGLKEFPSPLGEKQSLFTVEE